MTFKKTAIATFVGAALSTIALSATAVDYNNISSFQSAKNVLAGKQKANVETVSGMHNQFDVTLAKTTFQWAAKNSSIPNLGAISAEYKNEFAADFYLSKLTGFSANKSKLTEAKLANMHDIGRGAKIAKYKQEVAGVEIFNREYNIMMDREYNLVASSGYFTGKNATKYLPAIKNMTSAFGDSADAINVAFSVMGGDSSSLQLTAKAPADKFDNFSVSNLSAGKQLVGQPRAKKVFFEHKNKLVAAHYVEIETSSVDSVDSDYFSYVIAAKSGEVLFKKNLVSHANFTYRAYADQDGRPWDGPHGNVIPTLEGDDPDAWITAPYLDAPLVTLKHGPISTKDAWLADDATTTSGNNVFAYIDAIAPQGFTNGDYTAETTSSNTFDYKYNVAEPEYSMNNRKGAIVNMFLINNYLHDDYYGHGFDEASGNAQVSNYGRGGVEGDALNVEVQDNSGFNNANMGTPADGRSPRMQMFLWDKKFAANGVDWGITVTSDADIGLLASTVGSTFGPNLFEDVAGKLVRIEDDTPSINDGCTDAVNAADLAGNIAVIDRGACAFVLKVRNAQTAGAIAVIVANNDQDGTGDNVLSMGGADFEDIVIPNMMVSYNDGATLYNAMEASEVSVNMFKKDVSRSFKDSSWDNGVIAHEWGHYISNRLVGNAAGLSSNQAGSMGEGFGDFHALMLMSEADDVLLAGNDKFGLGYSDSPYVRSFATGIRRYPYSTNMALNPSTFADVEENPQVHASGSVWAAMLWDSYVDMINDERHTFAQAKSLMKDYLVAGYKMMPMAPTFTEARDAILSAAYANDIEDYKSILASFARRGMGLGALSPSRLSMDHAGVVESYRTDLATFTVGSHVLNTNYEGLMSGYCSKDNILDKGETGTVGFTVTNTGNSALTGVMGKVEVISGHNVTFADGGMVSIGDVAMFGSATIAPIEFTLNEAGTGDTLELKLTFPDLAEGSEAPQEYMVSTTTNVDFKTRVLTEGQTAQTDDFNTLSRLNDYTESVMVGGDLAKGTFGLNQWSATDGMISATGHAFTADVAYETRTMTVGFDGDYTVSFWHLYNFEEGFDGAVVEISVNGGAWADVTAMGGTFEGDGYTDTAKDDTEAAIAGRETFSGANNGVETINFGEVLNGNQVQFRFRVATDSGFVPEPAFGSFASGWYIDDMTFTNISNSIFSDVIPGDTYACDNRLPTLTVSANQTVNEGDSAILSVDVTDPNSADTFTYTWTQTAGATAVITGGDTANPTITTPNLDLGISVLEFNVVVSDGTGTVSEKVSLTVKADRTPEVEKKVSKSGGSTGLFALLLLPLALFRRRK
ncbi:MAG: hypothetical protein ACI9LM_002975 [Alteromonadaceae bacterium]|jgi:hypothetical protein